MNAMERIYMTVQTLRAAGIMAMRGYPKGKLPAFEGIAASVTLGGSDQRQTRLEVNVFGHDGQLCETAAQQVAQVLRDQAACCSVGSCTFDGPSELFAVKVAAVWREGLHDQVQVDGTALPYATDISAVQTRQVKQEKDTQTGAVEVVNEETVWTVAIQEWLPFGQTPEVDQTGAFDLKILRQNATEVYPDCCWLSITLEEGDGGVIRKRIARTWAQRVIEEET